MAFPSTLIARMFFWKIYSYINHQYFKLLKLFQPLKANYTIFDKCFSVFAGFGSQVSVSSAAVITTLPVRFEEF